MCDDISLTGALTGVNYPPPTTTTTTKKKKKLKQAKHEYPFFSPVSNPYPISPSSLLPCCTFGKQKVIP